MKNTFPNGIWPVMLTPFTEDNRIDYSALEKLIHWYEENGADGLFAVCQSSEMFFLSLTERVELASFIKKESRLPVIASGHISEAFEEQVRELNAMADTGIDALILITNRLARKEEPEEVLLNNLDALARQLPDTLPLGFYECPYPYKRLLTPETIQYCVETGRFHFIKDTSCDTSHMGWKLELIRDSELKLYNANTATLLETLELGASGYSGVMANFHPALYKWLYSSFKEKPEEARLLQQFLTMCSCIEAYNYPVIAKYAQQLLGNGMTMVCRKPEAAPLSYSERTSVEQLLEITGYMEAKYNIDLSAKFPCQ